MRVVEASVLARDVEAQLSIPRACASPLYLSLPHRLIIILLTLFPPLTAAGQRAAEAVAGDGSGAGGGEGGGAWRGNRELSPL